MRWRGTMIPRVRDPRAPRRPSHAPPRPHMTPRRRRLLRTRAAAAAAAAAARRKRRASVFKVLIDSRETPSRMNANQTYEYSTRTRLTRPVTSREFETTRRARSDSFFLSRTAQPPLGTGKGTRAGVVAIHMCATRPATAAIDSVGPVPPTKIAKCDIIPRRAE